MQLSKNSAVCVRERGRGAWVGVEMDGLMQIEKHVLLNTLIVQHYWTEVRPSSTYF